MGVAIEEAGRRALARWVLVRGRVVVEVDTVVMVAMKGGARLQMHPLWPMGGCS